LEHSFKVDKDLPNRLGYLLNQGSLESETEIMKILETLSEKLNALDTKKGISNAARNEGKCSTRLHQKWGKDPFFQEE
jgi:hypothetical protein